jgi:hypothetical protein
MRDAFNIIPFALALAGACASQTAMELAPAEDRRAIVTRELADGCVMPDPPQFAGELGAVVNELNARYRENEAGFIARDADRVMLLRHPHFHTITPDGTVSSRERMYERTRQFIGRVERFICVFETITALTLEGDTAHATVDQRTVRTQRFPDGTLHDIRTWVVQRESWRKVNGAWMMWRVDDIQPGLTVVDGAPLGPNP